MVMSGSMRVLTAGKDIASAACAGFARHAWFRVSGGPISNHRISMFCKRQPNFPRNKQSILGSISTAVAS